MLAAGAVALERRAARTGRAIVPLAVGALVLGGAVLAPIVAPILPAATLASLMPGRIQPVADRFGWPQLIATLGRVYRSLPPADQARATILAGNYGEAGAVDLLGPAAGLPAAISPQNTYYFWGKGTTPGAVVIAVDFDRADLTPYFASVRRAAIVPAEDGIRNEEVGRTVWVCAGPKRTWSSVWPRLKNFS